MFSPGLLDSIYPYLGNRFGFCISVVNAYNINEIFGWVGQGR